MLPDQHPITDRFPECLEARLRALPQPVFPVGLESRLLAAIPAKQSTAQPRRVIRVGTVVALVTVGSLAVFTWLWSDGNDPVPDPEASTSGQPLSSPTVGASEHASASWSAPRLLQNAESSSFTWPIENSLTSSIPPDLLD